jgi:DNA-binding LacI/PurR family transcriptional regulator
LQERGIPVSEIRPAGWRPHCAYQAGRQLAADPAVTAVLCGNDDLALGAIHGSARPAATSPGTVGVVGFDNTPQSAYCHPPLTTVGLDFVGRRRGLLRAPAPRDRPERRG